LVILGKGWGVSLPPVFFANQPSLLQLFIMLVLSLVQWEAGQDHV
jgi:hypothetical protein